MMLVRRNPAQQPATPVGARRCRRTGSHPRVKPEGMLRRDMRQGCVLRYPSELVATGTERTCRDAQRGDGMRKGAAQSPGARSSNLENGPEANTMRPPTMVSSEVIEPISAVGTLK
jgi:hypothetical protein